MGFITGETVKLSYVESLPKSLFSDRRPVLQFLPSGLIRTHHLTLQKLEKTRISSPSSLSSSKASRRQRDRWRLRLLAELPKFGVAAFRISGGAALRCRERSA